MPDAAMPRKACPQKRCVEFAVMSIGTGFLVHVAGAVAAEVEICHNATELAAKVVGIVTLLQAHRELSPA